MIRLAHGVLSTGPLVSLLLAFALCSSACGASDTNPEAGPSEGDAASPSDDDAASPSDDDAASPSDDDAASPSDDDATADDDAESAAIGESTGESIPIDHAMVKAAIQAHVTAHVDGIDQALHFLETSDALTNLYESLIGGGEEGEEGAPGEPGEPGEPADPAVVDDGPVIEIDLSEFRADLLEWLFDYVVVESTASASEDGKTLTYTITAEVFCDEEVMESEWMSEADLAREAERAEENEAECAQQLADSPLSLMVTTDGDDRLHLTLAAGLDATDVFNVQLRDDMLAGFVHLAGVKALLETFIDKDDFEFPDTMTGTVGLEVMKEAVQKYALRVTIEEALEMAGSAGQDALALTLAQNSAAGGLVLDGIAGTITGQLALGEVRFGIPWEMVVDITWDGEGTSEWVCVMNEATGMEDCWEEWIEGPEQPEVDGMANLTIPGITGAIEINGATDIFQVSDISLGQAMLTVDKDGQNIAQVALNQNDGWMFGLKMVGEDAKTTRFEMTPLMDAKVVLAMDYVKESFRDLPDFMLADVMGVTMQGDETPSVKLMRNAEDDVKVQVASGQLTLWSDSMDDDVVVEAGQCLAESDQEFTDEEEEGLHDLFGRLVGGSCEE
jgi:hypothetical protein